MLMFEKNYLKKVEGILNTKLKWFPLSKEND